MTRHRIAQIGENRNPKSPENRPQTRRFLQIRLLQLRRSATPFNGLAVLHGRLSRSAISRSVFYGDGWVACHRRSGFSTELPADYGVRYSRWTGIRAGAGADPPFLRFSVKWRQMPRLSRCSTKFQNSAYTISPRAL